MSTNPVALAVVAGAAAVALLATSATAVVQTRRLADERARADALAAEVGDLERRVAELEREPAGGDGGLDGLLGGLLGGDGGGLLDGLLGGAGLGDIPGARCLTPGGSGLDGLLDGLLGGDTGDLDGLLDGLLGGDTGDLDGLLGGLLGGDTATATATDPDELVEQIRDHVAELRELAWQRDVEVAFLDDAGLTAELEAILDGDLDLDELAVDQAILTALRAIPADADLEQLIRDLLDGQVAGFYSPEDERLVVRSPDGQIRPMDRIILAHELDHALVDQVMGLPDPDDGTDADGVLARLAVVEGDATLLMNHWTLSHLPFQEQLAIGMSGELAAQEAQLAAFPHHLRQELLFPYTDGLELVCDRWLDGGWGAVDAAYDTPPATTAGVLWPERAGEVPADAPSLTTPAGATLRRDDTFGAAPLSWLFEAPGGDVARALDGARERAAAWAAGAVHLWDVDGAPAVGLALRDRQAGDPALCDSVTDWWAAADPAARRDETGGAVRFTGEDTVTAIACEGDAVRVAIATDAAVAATITGSG